MTALVKESDNPEKYLLEGQNINDPKLELNIVNLIKGKGNIDKYLDPNLAKKLGLSNSEITLLAKLSGNIEKYLFNGQKADDKYLYIGMANLVKATRKG